MSTKRAVVVGAGVVGTLTAEALWNKGYEVTVVEKNDFPALGTSFGNAGQLCGPFCLPFAAPGFLTSFFKKSFANKGVGLSFADAIKNLPWLFRFFKNCEWDRYRENSETMLRLAYESVAALETVRLRHQLDFEFRFNCGKLYLYDSSSALHSSNQLLQLRRQIGYDVQALSAAECIALEPLLGKTSLNFAGGIYASDSSVGDCAVFTQKLAQRLQSKGVEFKFHTDAHHLITSRGKVTGLETSDGQLSGDLVVLATANGTAKLLPGALRAKYLIAPLKGYSVTLPLLGEGPKGTITDASRAVAFSVLGDSLRVTGGAFLSSSTVTHTHEIKRLLSLGKAWFPGAADYDVEPSLGWSGLRPVSPSSAPYIGRTDLEGLLINTGHGGFGWTCAAGSAQRLVNAVVA